MALYIPQARRRRRVLLIGSAAAAVGLVVGGVGGRMSAPTVDDRVTEVRQSAKDTAAGLRVVSLHVSDTTVGAGGTDLVLVRTGEELDANFDEAPWLSPGQEQILRDTLAGLKSTQPKNTKEFGDRMDAFATMIEDVFNGRPVSAPSPTASPPASAAASENPTPDPGSPTPAP